MRGMTARKEEPTGVLQLTARKKFGRYKKETEWPARKMAVGEDRRLKEMTEAFCRFSRYTFEMALEDSKLSGTLHVDRERYAKAVGHVKKLEYAASDVERFSIALPQIIEEVGERFNFAYMGLFLSALVNEGGEEGYTVHTLEFGEHLDYLGFMNVKNLTVNGDVGLWPGYRMASGTLHIKGNTQTVKRQHGGKIFIDGDAKSIGLQMLGGELYVDGDISLSSDDVKKGKIFHKEKLIVDK